MENPADFRQKLALPRRYPQVTQSQPIRSATNTVRALVQRIGDNRPALDALAILLLDLKPELSVLVPPGPSA